MPAIKYRVSLADDEVEMLEALAVSATMIYNTRQKCVEEGVEAALHDRPRLGQAPKLSDKQCAQVIETACRPAPTGHDHWTLRLLADKVVQTGLCRLLQLRNGPSALKKTL